MIEAGAAANGGTTAAIRTVAAAGIAGRANRSARDRLAQCPPQASSARADRVQDREASLVRNEKLNLCGPRLSPRLSRPPRSRRQTIAMTSPSARVSRQ
jgi:hypothetical protein